MFEKPEKTQITEGIQDLSAEECKAVIGGDRVLFNYHYFNNTSHSLSGVSLLDKDAYSYSKS